MRRRLLHQDPRRIRCRRLPQQADPPSGDRFCRWRHRSHGRLQISRLIGEHETPKPSNASKTIWGLTLNNCGINLQDFNNNQQDGSCSARHLTCCTTRTLPYQCTPTGASCLPLALSCPPRRTRTDDRQNAGKPPLCAHSGGLFTNYLLLFQWRRCRLWRVFPLPPGW